jgi:alkaline phosphatase
MFIENCCWGKDELFATAMARRKVFGTIVHCAGSYSHDLRNEIAYGHVNRHYRFDNYAKRCCDNYPTHELGPIAKLLDINRGNRILTVSSFASKSAGLEEYIKTRDDATEEMKTTKYLSELLTVTEHTATPVRVFGVGKGTEYFKGKTVDNTDIAKFVIKALKGE